jgi:hypothetical protein
MRPLRPIILLLAAMALATGPAASQSATSHQRPPAPTAPAPSKRPVAQPKLSDQQLEAVIRAKFAKSKSANQFKVRVQGGVATIEGKTDVVQHKGSATRMAKVAGAVAVNNKVEVSDAAKKAAAGNLEEGRRRVQVKRGDARSSK